MEVIIYWSREGIGRSMRGTGRPTRCSGRMVKVELFLKKARDVVYSIDPPWVAKSNGRPAYDARGLVLCVLLKVKVKMDYRSISSSYLKANPDLLKIVGLDRAPSRETIRTALLKLPESYLKKLNDLLVEQFKKGSSSRLTQQTSQQRDMRHGLP
jgi:hypothetical protein